MAEEAGSAVDLPELNRVGCSMVVIREKKSEWNVFPPVNHENLQVPSQFCKDDDDDDDDEDEEGQHTPSSFSPPSSDLLSSPSNSSVTSSSSTSPFPPSEDGYDGVNDDELVPEDTHSPDSNVQVREVGDVGGWWGIGFLVLRSKVWGLVGWPLCRGNAARGRAFWSFAPAAVAALWLLYWRFQLWRRRNLRQRREERVMRLVKEKDEVRSHFKLFDEMRVTFK